MAVTIDIPLFEDSMFADKARNNHQSLTSGWQGDNLREFTATLTGKASVSNFFSVAFGADTVITNGALQAEENAVVFQWNGRWEMRPRGFHEIYYAAPLSAADGSEKTLTVKILVSESGDAKSLAFFDGETPISFTGLDISTGIPSYLKRPDSWNMLRATARGFADGESPSITGSFVPYGTVMIIR